MENNLPIGVFDSGIGGLTVVKELQKLLPYEDIIYFGDTLRAPYGSRPVDEILEFMREILDYMMQKQVKLAVVACNTMTMLGLDLYRDRYPFLSVGVNSGAQAALSVTKNNRIAVLATEATISSKKHASYIHALNPHAEVFGQPCPLLVPLIEKGCLQGEKIDEVLDEYLSDIKASGVDTVILGCTHYPIVQEEIQKKLGALVTLINPAYETACDVKNLLNQNGLARNCHKARYNFGFSGNIKQARKLAELIVDVSSADFSLINLQDFKDSKRKK